MTREQDLAGQLKDAEEVFVSESKEKEALQENIDVEEVENIDVTEVQAVEENTETNA
jgi:hypothetical protein